MLKEEIVEKISKYFKLTSFEAEKIYDDIFSIIISGVKQDNIVDVANFGEFIIKFNKGNGDSAETNGYKKTVEFLATSKFENEINQNVNETVYMTPSISESGPVNETVQPPVIETTIEPPSYKFEETTQSVSNPVEEELTRKREEILNRITKPVEEVPAVYRQSGLTKPLWKIPAVEKEKVPENIIHEEKQPEKITDEVKEPEKTEPEEIVQKETESIKPPEKFEILQDAVLKEPIEDKKKEEADDFSKKTFSDFFTEVKQEDRHQTAEIEKTVEQPRLQNVIPPGVVELHNEITGSGQREKVDFPGVESNKTPVTANGNGNGTGEYRANDNSYYIWYKDVDANATDTQNLSYEYELLYQATKEAEYKSKLKIYVTTFIIFFSIVLVLLIFSPVIYKIFFKPVETPPNTESVNEEKPVTEQNALNNKAEQNVLQDANTNTQNNNVTPPVAGNDQQNQQQLNTTQNTTQQSAEQPKTETKTEQPVQQQQVTKLDGVTQNSMGWSDDKLKLMYVKLDNGKFAIQESSWDSDAKANKRIGIVQSYKIEGLTGSVVKTDLGAKGTWYRTRFGEFTTLELARQKAAELRKKEGS